MIYLKTRDEIELMRESALMVSKTLAIIAKEVKPGVEPIKLDKLAEEFIRDNGGIPAFKGYGHKNNPFPATLCISINEAVVHGIPTNKPLIEGDIISVDCGVKKNGYYGDHAYTFAVGEIKPEVQKLIDVTKQSLLYGIEQMVSGNRIGDISYAIQKYAEENGFGVVRELVGHGLGKNLHEEPEVPNYGKRGNGPKLTEGMVLAIEPMINLGTKNIKQLKDGWTIITADGKPSAHFEHDVAIVDGKPEILSSYIFIEEALASLK
ncbi:MAG: type I methionyl aminopeptidase [Bacteroidota bacterium]|nr:type I methionyl aminopeptidase [Bacteroidota bacterium]MDP3145894.1 type I methionyl aminopeptidase [Bacteroidota bacterium]MDP3558528.1 type I methionyl aminopeptidase [Bacteroidota bacterium]